MNTDTFSKLAEICRARQDAGRTEKTLTRLGYSMHHRASKKRYCRRSDIGSIEEYSGRFGTGFIVYLGRYRNSHNFSAIAYYVK